MAQSRSRPQQNWEYEAGRVWAIFPNQKVQKQLECLDVQKFVAQTIDSGGRWNTKACRTF